jgi:hypothetical protein
MNFEYVPLLQIQYSLYQMPRNFERFQAYLQTMIDAETNDLKLPLVTMNPMGKEHLLPFLEELFSFDAEEEAAQTTAEVQLDLGETPGSFRVSLLVIDDLLGGWTNRYVYEYNYRSHPMLHRPRVWTNPWITVNIWTSERYTAAKVREEVRMCLYRVAHIQQHGVASNLKELLVQEGEAMLRAGASTPTLDEDDLAYTREVLTPYLSKAGEPILIPALFGDPAASELGYQPLGLSPRAGLALALHDARMLAAIEA